MYCTRCAETFAGDGKQTNLSAQTKGGLSLVKQIGKSFV